MRRFWIPLWFGALFLGLQLAWEGLNFLSIGLVLRSANTDFYVSARHSSLARFVAALTIGMGCGLAFAALDFGLHRHGDPSGYQ
ncbi:MAG TPA: hypothetical protein VF627_15870, partial [Abditibacterium sp.]